MIASGNSMSVPVVGAVLQAVLCHLANWVPKLVAQPGRPSARRLLQQRLATEVAKLEQQYLQYERGLRRLRVLEQ